MSFDNIWSFVQISREKRIVVNDRSNIFEYMRHSIENKAVKVQRILEEFLSWLALACQLPPYTTDTAHVLIQQKLINLQRAPS